MPHDITLEHMGIVDTEEIPFEKIDRIKLEEALLYIFNVAHTLRSDSMSQRRLAQIQKKNTDTATSMVKQQALNV